MTKRTCHLCRVGLKFLKITIRCGVLVVIYTWLSSRNQNIEQNLFVLFTSVSDGRESRDPFPLLLLFRASWQTAPRLATYYPQVYPTNSAKTNSQVSHRKTAPRPVEQCINIHRNNDQKPIRKQWALNFREKCELLEKTAEVGIHFSVLDALSILALV